MRPSGSGASRFNDLTGGPGIARQEQCKRNTVTVVLIFCSEWLAGSVCSLLRQVAKGEGGISGQGKIEG